MNLFDCTGEVAVVIGATGVLGGAAAQGLAAAGATVAVLGRNPERGAQRVELILAAGGQALFIPCDASDRDQLHRAHQTVESRLGPPTVLVNAAGGNEAEATVTPERGIEGITPEAWNGVIDLNLAAGCLLPCQEFGPGMVARGKGAIITLTSVAAHLPLSRVVGYSAAKAAVLNLSQFLAREWARSGVRVNTITPGFFPAEQNRRLLFTEDGSPTPRAQQILAHTPLGRFGREDELMGAVVYLACARASSFVTGTDLRVDGGFLAQTV
jgi:NAD(P)-dependent dehydrogenase (short-subunit alcohol dehydrogenase family)